jgi:hypothetical protein
MFSRFLVRSVFHCFLDELGDLGEALHAKISAGKLILGLMWLENEAYIHIYSYVYCHTAHGKSKTKKHILFQSQTWRLKIKPNNVSYCLGPKRQIGGIIYGCYVFVRLLMINTHSGDDSPLYMVKSF